MSGILFVVATPIGNLKDITLRALEVLAAVDLIACEDTRRAAILLGHYAIKKPLLSYHSYNKLQRRDRILAELSQGRAVALISDAGTPGISDPGAALIAQVISAGIRVEAIPGAAAFLTALTVSGKPMNAFTFLGFLPVKNGPRRAVLETFKAQQRTIIFYESGPRLIKTLGDIQAVFGEAPLVVARELTKKFEEIQRLPPAALIAHYQQARPRGEFVVVF